MKSFLAGGCLVVLFLVIYGPVAGEGLIADDYGWIVNGLPAADGDIIDPFRHNVGFYRPLVTLSFAANYKLSGLHAKPYGATNLALALACAALIVWLARLHGLASGFAIFAAGLWLFNFHGINMAVLWTSGRTSLLLTAFSLLAAIAFVTRRLALAALLCLLAMLSKEEAVVLPALFTFWAMNPEPRTRNLEPGTRNLFRVWPLWVVLLIYLALRAQSGAFGPTNAPPYYAFSMAPSLLLRNLGEYADRACTLSVFALLIIFLCARARPRIAARDRVVVYRSAAWLVGGFALTIFLPVRSSLYAVFPSVGAAIAAAAFAAAWWPQLSMRARRALMAAGLIFPLALFPVYQRRNQPWLDNARLARAVVRQLDELAARSPAPTVILLDEQQANRTNLHSAFGSALSVIPRLITERPLIVWVEPPAPGIDLAGITPPPRDEHTVVLRLVDQRGTLVPASR